MRLFISYARIDKPYTIQLVTTLGVHEVWYDQRLYAGQHWWKEILRRLDWCEGLIYLLSPESVSSEYCLKELEIAQRLGREIIPVLIQPNTEIPPSLAKYQYVDMTNGMAVENVNLLWDSIYLSEQSLIHRKQKPVSALPKESEDVPALDDPKVVGQAASALENGEYDRAVFLLRQAKSSGYKPKFLDLDRLLKEAEIALEQKTREREAKREYAYILDVYQYAVTRDIACEAFAEFQKYFPEYDPEGLAKRCGRVTTENP
ncbi:MAG: toll/interleukin-1 receptor domain-containing protein, partial [Aggregatilineales bacterium]